MLRKFLRSLKQVVNALWFCDVSKETYLDSSVLLCVLHGKGATFAKSYQIINEPSRRFLSSDYVRLETLPKPTFYKKQEALNFLNEFFGKARIVASDADITKAALGLACKHDINAADALHLSSAVAGKATEFVTAEQNTKPVFRATETGVKLTSIYFP